MERVVIIDYDAGNLRSVQRACLEVGGDATISKDPKQISQASRIIFPGVGAAGSAMRSIQKYGIDEILLECFDNGVPILGICMGMQISMSYSEEDNQQTIGIVEGEVRRFKLQNRDLKIPHMGWNEVRVVKSHPILSDISAGDEFYFVHAYYPTPIDAEHIFALAEYESDFCCALGKENFFGTQFHPEKSGRIGLRLLSNFLEWDGRIAQ